MNADERMDLVRKVDIEDGKRSGVLKTLGVPRSTYYKRRKAYGQGGIEALRKTKPSAQHIWNRLTDEEEKKVVVAEEDPPATDDDLGTVTARIAVRNYEDIYNTYASLTGIDGRVARVDGIRNGLSIRDYFVSQLAGALPTSSDAGTFGAASFVASIKLASQFCNAAWDRRAQAAFLGLPTINNGLEVNTPGGRTQLVAALAEHVWGTSVEGDIASLSALGNDIGQDLTAINATPDTRARGTAVGVCVAALASARTLFH